MLFAPREVNTCDIKIHLTATRLEGQETMSKQEKRKKTPHESLQLFMISSLDLTVAPPK